MTSSDQIAIAAAFIAFCAFVTSIWQARLAREHNRLSVRPAIEITISTETLGTLKINLTNHGMGTAKIRTLKVWVKEHEMLIKDQKSASDFFKNINDSNLATSYRQHLLLDGSYLAADADITLFEIKPYQLDDAQSLDAILKNNLAATEIEVAYECIYGKVFIEHWPSAPKPVDHSFLSRVGMRFRHICQRTP